MITGFLLACVINRVFGFCRKGLLRFFMSGVFFQSTVLSMQQGQQQWIL